VLHSDAGPADVFCRHSIPVLFWIIKDAVLSVGRTQQAHVSTKRDHHHHHHHHHGPRKEKIYERVATKTDAHRPSPKKWQRDICVSILTAVTVFALPRSFKQFLNFHSCSYATFIPKAIDLRYVYIFM
jgi:hypothetical protein